MTIERATLNDATTIFHHHCRGGLIMLLLLISSLLVAQNVEQNRTDHIATSADEICPLKVGANIPSVTVRTSDGAAIDLRQAATQKPTVLIFYRGGWCPYCNTHLKQLKDVEPELVKLGYQVLAVSADKPEKIQESTDKLKPAYRLLSDATMEAAKAFGIAFRVDETVVARYKQFNMDLEVASGETHHLLPVPAVFIVSTDGLIRFSYANPNYRVRIDPELLLTAAKTAIQKASP